MPWRQLLLESHSIAVLSAAGVALLAFPGADLAKSAQPRLARVVAPQPVQQPQPVLSKGPETRLTGASKPTAADTVSTAPASAPASKLSHLRVEEVPAARERRAFEGCLYVHEQAACRRAFEALIERQGGFTMVPAGERLGSRRMSLMPALTFDEAPQWRRRFQAISEDGIPFKRVRRGNDHELTIGITPDGVLGFSLEETPSGR